MTLRPVALTLLLLTSTAAISQNGVTNSPYTATKKTTWIQKLADGTTITRVSTETEARDSQGRTARLRVNDLPGGGHTTTQHFIVDPVSLTNSFWTSPGKEVNITHLPDARRVVPTPSGSSQPPISTSGGGVVGSGSGVSMGTFVGGEGRPIAFGVSPGPISSTDPHLQPANKQEKLEPKNINGVYAEGFRFTTVFPTGYFGNDRPITTVHETWTSPDLKIIVLTISDDPRFGTQTTEITSLDRAEPDPALFQIPEGYTIHDQYPGSNGPPR